MTLRQILMAAGVVLAGALFIFGDRTPADAVAEAVTRSKTSAPAPAQRNSPGSAPAKAVPVILTLEPRAHLPAPLAHKDADDADDARGLFASRDWTPLPVPPVAVKPPPPAPPPMPFTYIGKAASDGVWEVFLASADKTYVVRAHTVIDGVYRVESIAPPLLAITYLPMNRLQQIPIGVLD